MQGLELRADPLLSRVFYNLVDNSKSHGKTVKRIRVTYSHFDDEVKIIYEDDGVGIPADMKARIFEDHRSEEGFGLLLAKSILDITEIKIRETGKPGMGACFEISVPRGSFRLADQ